MDKIDELSQEIKDKQDELKRLKDKEKEIKKQIDLQKKIEFNKQFIGKCFKSQDSKGVYNQDDPYDERTCYGVLYQIVIGLSDTGKLQGLSFTVYEDQSFEVNGTNTFYDYGENMLHYLTEITKDEFLIELHKFSDRIDYLYKYLGLPHETTVSLEKEQGQL
jgi:hypothetical protein